MKEPLKERDLGDKTCGMDGMLHSLCTFVLNILKGTVLTYIINAHSMAARQLYSWLLQKEKSRCRKITHHPKSQQQAWEIHSRL